MGEVSTQQALEAEVQASVEAQVMPEVLVDQEAAEDTVKSVA